MSFLSEPILASEALGLQDFRVFSCFDAWLLVPNGRHHWRDWQ